MGGVSVCGLKLALFDMSDVENPVLVDKVEIGISGSDSEVLRDHKAFLFEKGRNLLVIPVEEVSEVPGYSGKPVSYTYGYWNGAYVFKVTPNLGFILSGKILHSIGPGSIYGYERVLRSLYIDDIL